MNQSDLFSVKQFSPRERVLAAALKLFVEQGYFNTNIPDLSRESKCSIGSIYHTFLNKEEVAAALYEEGLKALREALFRSMEDIKDEERILRELVRSFLEFSEVNHQLSRYLWLSRHHEFMKGDIRHPTRIGFDPLGRLLTHAIKGGTRKGIIRPLPANILWSVLFGIPLAYVRDWLDGFNSASPQSVAPTLADTCWNALSTK